MDYVIEVHKENYEGMARDSPSGSSRRSPWRRRSCSVQFAQSPQKLSAWPKIIQPCRGQNRDKILLSDN